MKILVVEDERPLSDALVELLKQNGCLVDAEYNGHGGLDAALTGLYDLILLDIMLPLADGLTVLSELRKAKVSTPVLLLTAKAEIADKIAGLDAGADDYLTKPFAAGELLARVRAMTRRKSEFVGDVLRHRDTTLDRSTHLLACGGKSVKLGLKEFQVMEMLMENTGKIVARDRFIEKIWGYDSDAEYNAIEVYISFLRKKLQAIASAARIKAARGVGYTLSEALEEETHGQEAED